METITEKNFQSPVEEAESLIVKFTNFSDEDFTYTWNKVPYTFKAGSVKFMESGIAKHFAKHLVNRELLKRGRDSDTSPKKPSENPFFMELYNKCIQVIPTDGESDAEKAKQEMIDKNMKAKLGIKDEESVVEEKEEAPAPKKSAKKLKAKKEEEFEEIEVPEEDSDE